MINPDLQQTSASERDYREYDNLETIERYRRASAGEGIDYLLRTTYGPLFMASAQAALRDTGSDRLRVLEFGCGAGMALHHLVEMLGEAAIEVDLAVGTDFVPAMVAAAEGDRDAFGSEWAKERMRYVVAPNETLARDIAEGLSVPAETLARSFHIAIGVNAFRFAVRHDTSAAVVGQLNLLLARGGRTVIIDMNDRFPYGLKPTRKEPGERGLPLRLGNAPLPSLSEYARPFRDAGFEVLREEHFCWIPHSARGARYRLARAASPLLDRLVPERAMRSLVVAAKR